MTWATTPWAVAPLAASSAEELFADGALTDAVTEGIAADVTVAAGGEAITASAGLVDTVAEGVAASVEIMAAIVASGDLADTVAESLAATVSIGGAPSAVTVDAALTDAVVEGLAATLLLRNPSDPTMQPGRWIVPVGTRRTPVHIHFDAAQTDDLTFRVGPALLPGESIQVVDVRCEARVGDDAGASEVLVGVYQVSGSDVLQRIRARSLAQVYLIRALVTLNSGRELVGAALLHVVRQA